MIIITMTYDECIYLPNPDCARKGITTLDPISKSPGHFAPASKITHDGPFELRQISPDQHREE